MFPNLENATNVEWAAVVGAMGVVLFGVWNCIVDILPWPKRRRTDEDNRRIAGHCATAVMEKYGRHHDEAKREVWQGRIAKVLHETLSSGGVVGGPKARPAEQLKRMGARTASRQRAARPKV